MEVTHKGKILTQGWQCSGDLKPFLDFRPAVWNGFGSQTSHAESIKSNFFQDALPNFVILRHIFTFLGDEDLESCCHVCQDWRTVADSLVLPHFDIKLAKSREHNPHNSAQLLANCKLNIVARERARYNRKRFARRKAFVGVTRVLEALLKKQRVSVSLRLSKNIDIQDKEVLDFLSKIGPLVQNLDIQRGAKRKFIFSKR